MHSAGPFVPFRHASQATSSSRNPNNASPAFGKAVLPCGCFPAPVLHSCFPLECNSCICAGEGMSMLDELWELWTLAQQEELQHSLLTAVAVCTALAAVVTAYIFRRARPVYLLNYSVYKPPEEWRASHDQFLEISRLCGVRPCPVSKHLLLFSSLESFGSLRRGISERVLCARCSFTLRRCLVSAHLLGSTC